MTDEEEKERKRREFAKKLEEQKKEPQESVYTKLAKSGWLGTRAKITAESEK